MQRKAQEIAQPGPSTIPAHEGTSPGGQDRQHASASSGGGRRPTATAGNLAEAFAPGAEAPKKPKDTAVVLKVTGGGKVFSPETVVPLRRFKAAGFEFVVHKDWDKQKNRTPLACSETTSGARLVVSGSVRQRDGFVVPHKIDEFTTFCKQFAEELPKGELAKRVAHARTTWRVEDHNGSGAVEAPPASTPLDTLSILSSTDAVATRIYEAVALQVMKETPRPEFHTGDDRKDFLAENEQHAGKIYDETMLELVSIPPAGQDMTVAEFIDALWPERSEAIRGQIYENIVAGLT